MTVVLQITRPIFYIVFFALLLNFGLGCAPKEEPEGPAEQIGKGIDQIRSGIDRLGENSQNNSSRSGLSREERAKIAADEWERKVREEEEQKRKERERELSTRRPMGADPYADWR